MAVRAQSEEERVAIARAQYEEAMKNPETAKKMQDMLQEQMKQPGVQEQMQMMQQMMQNPQLMARLQSLKDDPDMKPYFDEVREGDKRVNAIIVWLLSCRRGMSAMYERFFIRLE